MTSKNRNVQYSKTSILFLVSRIDSFSRKRSLWTMGSTIICTALSTEFLNFYCSKHWEILDYVEFQRKDPGQLLSSSGGYEMIETVEIIHLIAHNVT